MRDDGMTMGEFQADVRINSGDPVPGLLRIEQEMIQEQTNLPQPDMGWTFIDAAGHFHAFSADRELPTLDAHREHKPCDGSCGGLCGGEGFDEVWYSCRICQEKIKPGSVAGPHTFTVPGFKHWSVTARWPVSVSGGIQASLLMRTTRGTYFGVGKVTGVDIDGNVEFDGYGPLGKRP